MYRLEKGNVCTCAISTINIKNGYQTYYILTIQSGFNRLFIDIMNFVQVLLTTTHQLHVYHWQTESYAAHQAFGGAYDAIDGLMDQFVEVFMGKYGKVASKGGFDIKLANITDKKPEDFIDEVIEFMTTEVPKVLKETDSDLLNIRDEIVAELNKLKYLLTLS